MSASQRQHKHAQQYSCFPPLHRAFAVLTGTGMFLPPLHVPYFAKDRSPTDLEDPSLSKTIAAGIFPVLAGAFFFSAASACGLAHPSLRPKLLVYEALSY
jgi:hypothetical protein